MIPAGLKKWLAAGSGVGIQIAGPRGAESMQRRRGTRSSGRSASASKILCGGFTIENFPHQPAGVWGTDYAAFLEKLGMRHVAATVVLPRQDVIVRQLVLPGVSDKDLDGAVQFQMDGLHPYNEDDVFSSWARLPGTSTVLVAMARKEVVERYAALFAEAGIKIGAFTCSAAAVYSALRLFGAPASREILAWDDSRSRARRAGWIFMARAPRVRCSRRASISSRPAPRRWPPRSCASIRQRQPFRFRASSARSQPWPTPPR